MGIYLPTGQKTKHVCVTVQDYTARCLELSKTHGDPFFEMDFPNNKIFKVFRDRHDNEIEVVFNPQYGG